MVSKIDTLKREVESLEGKLKSKQAELARTIRQEEVAANLRYYVYFCLVDGEMAYIGKGTGDRWKHTISGISSCRELNRDWFSGKSFSVFRTEDNLTEDEALLQEEEFIFSFVEFGKLHNRVLPSEDTKFSDWTLVLQQGDKEQYGSSDLAIMHKCFKFLGKAKND